MISKTKPVVISLFILLFMNMGFSSANPPGGMGGHQWIVSGRTGTAWLLKEVSRDFTFLNNELSHKAGLALDLSISRTIGKSWEPGILFSVASLSGEADLPDFSANGLHPSFISLYQAPVAYSATSTALSGFMRYHFRKFEKTRNTIRFDPYAELGGGVNYFFTQLAYKNPPDGENDSVIFGKGTGEKPRTAPGNVAQISLGIGTRIEMPQNMNLIFSINTDVVNYDCLDAVHNYTDGERNHASSIVPRLMIGVSVPLGGKSRSGGDSHLPWSR